MEENENYFYTVKDLIEFLQGCRQDAIVYYTLGGSGNNVPVTYVEEDYEGLEIEDEGGGVLLGELTW